MDITLERILSLLPRKSDGKLVHGAKKAFAESIGLKGGNLISDWEAGRVTSYRNYLYEIADKYNVSVEWLKGETDIKEKAAPTNGDDFIKQFSKLTPDNQELIRKMVESLASAQPQP